MGTDIAVITCDDMPKVGGGVCYVCGSLIWFYKLFFLSGDIKKAKIEGGKVFNFELKDGTKYFNGNRFNLAKGEEYKIYALMELFELESPPSSPVSGGLIWCKRKMPRLFFESRQKNSIFDEDMYKIMHGGIYYNFSRKGAYRYDLEHAHTNCFLEKPMPRPEYKVTTLSRYEHKFLKPILAYKINIKATSKLYINTFGKEEIDENGLWINIIDMKVLLDSYDIKQLEILEILTGSLLQYPYTYYKEIERVSKNWKVAKHILNPLWGALSKKPERIGASGGNPLIFSFISAYTREKIVKTYLDNYCNITAIISDCIYSDVPLFIRDNNKW